jgi:Trk K+ transport system NAD-binding subunit
VRASPDLFLIYSVAIGLVLAALGAIVFGIPMALAAFVAGLAIKSGEDTDEVRRVLLPFRDLFAVLFFVLIGSLIQPSQVLAALPFALMLLLLMVVLKTLPTYLIIKFTKIKSRALQHSIGLSQMGEFSFVLGAAGLSAKAISPEQTVTDYLIKLIEIPEALQVIEFAHGMVSLLAVKADSASPLVGHPVRDLKEHLPHIESRIVAVFRGNSAITPDGDTQIEAGDEVFFVASTRHIRQITKELRQEERSVKRMMIAGGGNIGLRVAKGVSGYMTPKIIEGNRTRCNFLAQELNGQALVLHGDTTDEELLAQENIGSMDLFLALTNDDENNIMSALLAKKMGARRWT